MCPEFLAVVRTGSLPSVEVLGNRLPYPPFDYLVFTVRPFPSLSVLFVFTFQGATRDSRGQGVGRFFLSRPGEGCKTRFGFSRFSVGVNQ